jgi:hypothetical protein
MVLIAPKSKNRKTHVEQIVKSSKVWLFGSTCGMTGHGSGHPNSYRSHYHWVTVHSMGSGSGPEISVWLLD